MTPNKQALSLLAEALQARRFLLVWADVPFPPEERPPRNPARTIHQWQEDACALPLLPFDFAHGKPWPLVGLPPLPILSLDPSERVENAFRYAGVPLHVALTRRDAPARDQHNLFKLGGDLVARAELLLSWDDARAASSDPDKVHLLDEVRRLAQDGAVLALAPSPNAAFARLWSELLTPALQGARHQFVLGPADFAWPAPLVRLEGEVEELLAALADRVIPPPLEPAQERLDSVRRQLAEEQENLLLIEERKTKFVMSTSVPLHLVKEERRLRKRIAELEAELAGADAPAARGGRERFAAPVAPPGPIRDRWALLVGVNRYVDPAFPWLNFCVNDVLALERALKELGYTVVALHDDADEERLLPTRDNVEAELARLCDAAGPDDLLLAHFACHGKLEGGHPFLVTRETRAPTLASKALPLAEVERRMRESQARRLVLTLDACHTGVEIGRDLADPEFIQNVYERAEGFALIAASTAQQIAQEWREKEHGVFTYYLLEGLSGQADRGGKGFVTVGDLETHVLDGLRRWNVEHGGLIQEPTARTEGLGDMILADYR